MALELRASDIEEGSLNEHELDGHLVLVTRIGGVVHAIGGRCRHLGCHLARGTLDGTIVTCPCHGSRFDVITGKLVEAVTKWPKALRGPVSLAVGDEPVYRVEEEGETIRVSR